MTENYYDSWKLPNAPCAIERMYGDFSPGRYVFKLENVRMLREPVAARGALGFWYVGLEPEAQVLRALKADG